MTQRIKDLYCDLLEIQFSGKADVIITYFGNTNNFGFSIFIPKWQSKVESDYRGDYFLDTNKGEEEFAKGEQIVKLLKKLICNEKVSATANNSPTIVHEYTYSREGTTAWDVTNND